LTERKVKVVLEDGPRFPALEDVYAVLRALGRTPGEFFGELYGFAPRAGEDGP